MTDSTRPSRNPSNDDTLSGTLKTVLRKYRQSDDNMLPCEVIAYNRLTNRVSVKPLIAVVDTEGNVIPRANIPSLPVLQMGGGGFFISFNLTPGDLGWIQACDRDISLFLQSYAESEPNTKRMHNFSDALFIPDVMNKAPSPADINKFVLQNTAGTTKITMEDSEVTVQVGSAVFSITAGQITATVPKMLIDGELEVSGEINSNQQITAFAANPLISVSMNSHTHISNGPGNQTNAPTPGT